MRAPRRVAGGVLVALAVTLTVGCGSQAHPAARVSPSGRVVAVGGGTATPYGVGASRVWILRPRHAAVRSIVVYLHGWNAYLPFEWHQTWFEHLLRGGSAVVFPAYQDGIDDSFFVAPYDMRDALTLGFRVLNGQRPPIVAVGFSVGGTLALVYAARADEWGLPKPRAIYSIFPVDPYEVDPSVDLSSVRGIPVVLRAGDHDDVVGRAGTDSFAALLGSQDARFLDYRIVRSQGPIWADHELLPTSAWDPSVRQLFWPPLDRLIDGARSSAR